MYINGHTTSPVGPLEGTSVRPCPVGGRSDSTACTHPISGTRRAASVEKRIHEGASDRGQVSTSVTAVVLRVVPVESIVRDVVARAVRETLDIAGRALSVDLV